MKKIFCYLFGHRWEIVKWCIFKNRKCTILQEEGFNRQCLRCDKTQQLQKPKEYHPTKYVWNDINLLKYEE